LGEHLMVSRASHLGQSVSQISLDDWVIARWHTRLQQLHHPLQMALTVTKLCQRARGEEESGAGREASPEESNEQQSLVGVPHTGLPFACI
jgi:hypothetical protein